MDKPRMPAVAGYRAQDVVETGDLLIRRATIGGVSAGEVSVDAFHLDVRLPAEAIDEFRNLPR